MTRKQKTKDWIGRLRRAFRLVGKLESKIDRNIRWYDVLSARVNFLKGKYPENIMVLDLGTGAIVVHAKNLRELDRKLGRIKSIVGLPLFIFPSGKQKEIYQDCLGRQLLANHFIRFSI